MVVTEAMSNWFDEDPSELAQKESQFEAGRKDAAAVVRIKCPGCMACYEVGRELIPLGGRDLQCSNCGHEWFHELNASVEMQQSQSSPSGPKLAQNLDVASQDRAEVNDGKNPTSIVHADFPPLTPSEVRLVISGSQEALDAFIASGRLNAVDPKGDTPLHLAARMGKLALCDILVRAGADPLALNHGRQRSADVARAEGHTLVAQLLYSLSAKSGRTEGIEGRTIGPLPDTARQTGSRTHLPETNEFEAREHEYRDQRETAKSATTTWTTECVGDSIRQPHWPQPSVETADPDTEQLRSEPLLNDGRDDFEDASREVSTARAVAPSNAQLEEPKKDEEQPAIRAELGSLDDLLQFEAEEEPEAYYGQSVGTKASGTFVALVSSAPSVPDQEAGNWNLDLSPVQIEGDGIGSTGLLSPVKGDEHGFLKVRNRGRKSTKRAVIQTGTQLRIDVHCCLAWAKELLAKGWCSGGDLDQLIDSCEGNGDPDELRFNLERNLELVGL